MKDSITLEFTEGQHLALDQLHRIVQASRGSVAATHVAAAADGYVEARVSVGCANLPPTQDGLRLRSVEAVTLRIPPNFPFTAPRVQTRHTRFMQRPARQLGPPPVPVPLDGDRVGSGRRHVRVHHPPPGLVRGGRRGTTGPARRTPAPPNALTDHTAGLLVIRHDAPVAQPDGPWLGAAVLHQVNDTRSDVVGWLAAEDPWPDSLEHLRESAGLPADARAFLAPVIVTTKHLTFEYPLTARELVESLARDHITPRLLLGLTGFVAGHNRTLLCPDATAPTGDDEGDPSRAGVPAAGHPLAGHRLRRAAPDAPGGLAPP